MDRHQRTVNVRIVSATNQSLSDMIAQGTFREDLFYRLDVIHLEVPPLRQHKEDLPQLIEHFLKRFSQAGGYMARPLAPDALGGLPLAWQRAGTGECDRAPRRHLPERRHLC